MARELEVIRMSGAISKSEAYEPPASESPPVRGRRAAPGSGPKLQKYFTALVGSL